MKSKSIIVCVTPLQASLDGSSPQIIQIQAPQQQQAQQQQQQQQQSTAQQAHGTTQVFQQIISPSGEVQNIPVSKMKTDSAYPSKRLYHARSLSCRSSTNF